MHLVWTSLLSVAWGGEGLGGWEAEPPTKFSKIGGVGGLDNTSTFRGGFWGKRGMTFFREGYNFYIKNKLKYEIFNDK